MVFLISELLLPLLVLELLLKELRFQLPSVLIVCVRARRSGLPGLLFFLLSHRNLNLFDFGPVALESSLGADGHGSAVADIVVAFAVHQVVKVARLGVQEVEEDLSARGVNGEFLKGGVEVVQVALNHVGLLKLDLEAVAEISVCIEGGKSSDRSNIVHVLPVLVDGHA